MSLTNIINTGSVALMAYRRPTDAYVSIYRDPRVGSQLWLLRLASMSLILADDRFPDDTDGTWDAVKEAMQQMATDVSLARVTLPDGSVLERDDAESM